MKLPNTSVQNRGLSLIEILIVIGLISFIGAIGITIGIDTYKRYIVRSDLDRVAVLLQKARSAAINNVGEMKHGVYFGDTGSFVLYRGANYASRLPNYDIRIERSPSVTVSGATEIIFDSFTAKTASSTLTVSDGVQNTIININSEGAIDW